MNPDLSRLTPAKLVEAELEGKFKAIAGYDDILWKIRAGYLAVVYGALGLLVGTKDSAVIVDAFKLPPFWAPLIVALLLVFGLSIAAFFVDFGYLRKKLKVIAAKDALVRFTVEREEIDQKHIGFLLRISGEAGVADFTGHEFLEDARDEYKRQRNWNLRHIHLALYGTAPVIMVLILLVQLLRSTLGCRE
jgi:hypothetical protein